MLPGQLIRRSHVESCGAVLSFVGSTARRARGFREGGDPRRYEGLAFAISPPPERLGCGRTKESTLLRDQAGPGDRAGQSGNAAQTNGAPPAKSNESELRRLEEELAQLGREAMEQGGLRDPGDYAEFLARREALEERIHILRQLDAMGRQRPAEENSSVAVGQRVTIQTEDGAEETWQIVPPAAARPREGLISDRSPLGHALMNRHEGDVVDVPSPEGSYKVTVIRVEHA